jgi:hypothetical protein
MAGNLLGPRGKYVYESDDGTNYVYTTDQDLAAAGLGVGAAAPVAFDPASPPANFGGQFPRGAEPRKVFVQDGSGNRKELIAASIDADLYATLLPTNVTIDTVTFTSTGRKGERFTF